MPTLQKTKIYYDALGRPVRTVNPNGSEQWAFQGIPDDIVTPVNPSLLSGVEAFTPTPWENYAYDSNDLADIVVVPNNNVPSSHYGTPKNSLVDALGRTTKTKEFFDNTDSTNVIEMNYSFDIRGNLLLVKDPYNRNVFEHVYDLRVGEKDSPAPPLWTKHIDKGISTVWFDAVGKPIRGDDAKGAVVLSSYDVISRPKNSWASNKTGDAITLRGYSVYGDSASLPSPQNSNLNGQVYESYDEAGKLEMTLYDFKSNLITKVRSVIADGDLKTALNSYTNLIIDWDSPPNLSPTIFTSDMAYDALNRITELTLPDDLDLERKKIIPTYNTAGALEKVDLYSPAGPTTTNYVENIAYNAKGQRLLIAFGNDMMTRYTYDPITFRLLRQRTEGYTKSAVGSTITYTYGAGTNKQDDAFNFDLVGNIVNIFTRVTDCGIGGNPDELDRVFEYDPIYRLTYADGRESDTQSGNTYLYDDAPIPSTPLPSNVNYYERNFVYDKLGNIESVVQSGTNGFTRDYTYNSGKNTLQKIENATPTVIESYTYDSNGNTLTTNLNRYYVWNHSDQLLGYYNQAGLTPTVSTQYDYAGQDRVSKMVRTASGNSFERTIYIDGIFEYIRLDNTSGTFEKNYIHIMDDKSRICEVRINPGTPFPGDITDDVVYVLEDQIGSSVVRLNTSGTVIDEEEYYPFGDSSLRTFTYKRYRYVGKERDSESGLHYYGARYYASWTCRFISVDPLAGKYQFYTPYQYAGNTPVSFIDLDGLEPASNKPGFYRWDDVSASAVEDVLIRRIHKFQEDAGISAVGTGEPLTKETLYDDADDATDALDYFSSFDMTWAERSLQNYLLGEGGLDIYSFNELKGYGQFTRLLSGANTAIENALKISGENMTNNSYQTVNISSQGLGAITSGQRGGDLAMNDFNLTFGATNMHFSGAFTMYKDDTGSVSYSGSVMYTFYDTYDYNADDRRRSPVKTGLGIADNWQMNNLLSIGAEPFYSRAYFSNSIVSDNGDFEAGPYCDVSGTNNPEPTEAVNLIPANTKTTYDGRRNN